MSDPTYDRPVKATLLVRLENGEEWEATPEDLEKFHLVNRLDAYMTFNRALTKALTEQGLLGGDGPRDLTDTELNPVRYLGEISITMPHLLDHPEHEGWKMIADLERRLRATPSAEVTA